MAHMNPQPLKGSQGKHSKPLHLEGAKRQFSHGSANYLPGLAAAQRMPPLEPELRARGR